MPLDSITVSALAQELRGRVTPHGKTVKGFMLPAKVRFSPDDVERLVWNSQCRQNLAVHLTRPEVKALGKPAVVVKG